MKTPLPDLMPATSIPNQTRQQRQAMNPSPAKWRVSVHSVFSVMLLLMLSLPAAPAPAEETDPVTLNFKDADIDTVVGAYGFLLDKTFIIDPRVRGKITVETPNPVSRAEAYGLLLSALRLQGFTIVTSGRIAKVVPEADAKLQSGPVNSGRKAPDDGDAIVTQVFRLNYESATNLVPVLRPLIAPNNTISAYPNNNSLVITDYASNLQRLSRIISSLDSPSGQQVEILKVQYGIASDLAITMNNLLDDTQRAGQGAQVDAGQRIMVVAEPNSNSIMVRASSRAKVSLARELLKQLDKPQENPGNIHVVYLRNAEAVKLAETLQASMGGTAAGGTSASSVQNRTRQATSVLSGASGSNRSGQFGGGSGGDSMQRLSSGQDSSSGPVTIDTGNAIIAADPTTNSLIITAPDAVYRNLRSVIDKLDTRRAQVYIESLIVEVNVERAAELGIQWQFLDVDSGGSQVIGGTNFGNLNGGGSILGASQNIANAGGGLNLGIVNGTTNIPGVGEVLNLPLLARALETRADGNILATPNLLTMDNEEARIIIGQNVPFVTGQYSATGTAGASVNPFQTIERKDVGTTLSVKPQVSESGTVKLQIFQEVSSVVASSVAADIITNRRAIETNVLVDDGQIVVLGGLIEERIEGSENKVPLLGDIPIIGQLFRYDSRKRVKTNLLVFLRPVVLRDARASYGVTASRYDFMREMRDDGKLRESWALPEFTPQPMATFPKPLPDAKPAPVKKGNESGGATNDETTEAEMVLPPGYRLAPGSLAPDVDRYIEQRGGPAAIDAERAPEIDLRQPTPVVPGRTQAGPQPLGVLPEPRVPLANLSGASREVRINLPPRASVATVDAGQGRVPRRQAAREAVVQTRQKAAEAVSRTPAIDADSLAPDDAYLN